MHKSKLVIESLDLIATTRLQHLDSFGDVAREDLLRFSHLVPHHVLKPKYSVLSQNLVHLTFEPTVTLYLPTARNQRPVVCASIR